MKPRSSAFVTGLNSTIYAARCWTRRIAIWKTNGVRISTGTIVDATIIHAPSSTKNSSGKHDPKMHQNKKDDPRYFGAKAHIGVDSKETVVHAVATTAASVRAKVEHPFRILRRAFGFTRFVTVAFGKIAIGCARTSRW